jgi:hypothetical protein
MKTSRLLGLLLLNFACGGGGSQGDLRPTDTIEQLPPTERAAFTSWARQPVKDCAWEQAFPALAKRLGSNTDTPHPAVDLNALYDTTHGSPVLQGPAGELTLLGAPTRGFAYGTREHSTRQTINGNTTGFSVKSERTDAECIVLFNEHEVFRAPMTDAVPVRLFVDAESLGGAGQDVKVVTDASGTVSRLAAGPLLAQPLASLTPSARAHAQLAAALGADVASVRALFPLDQLAEVLAARAPSLPGTVAFATHSSLYGPTATLAPLTQATTVSLELLVAPELPSGSTVDATLATQLLVFGVDVATQPGGTNARATRVQLKPAQPRSNAASVDCFLTRHQQAIAFTDQPTFVELFGGCSALSVDGIAALAESPQARGVVLSELSGPGGTRGGWDSAFVELVDRLAAKNTNLTEVDPMHAFPDADAMLERVSRYLVALPEPARSTLRHSIVAHVVAWGLKRVNLSSEFDLRVVTTLEHASAYPESLETLLKDVDQRTDSAERATTCAAALVGERAARVAATVGRLSDLPAAADFVVSLRSQLLQTCPSNDELGELDAALGAARAFVTADQLRGTSLGYEELARSFIGHALRERWRTATYTSLEALMPLAVLRSDLCSGLPTLVAQAHCFDDLEWSRLTVTPGKLLDPTRVDRHVAFALDLLPLRRGWLDNFDFLVTRLTIERSFFDEGLWVGCSNDRFQTNANALLGLLDQLRTSEGQRRIELSNAIDLLLKTTCP